MQLSHTHTHTHVKYTQRYLILFLYLATVLCLPVFDEMTNRVLIELDIAWQAQHIQNSVIFMIHTENIEPFLRKDERSNSSVLLDSSTLTPFAITQSSNFSTSNVTSQNDERTTQRRRLQYNSRRYSPPSNLTSITTRNLLAVAPLDQR